MDFVKMALRSSLSCETILRKAPNGDLIMIVQSGGTWEPQKENREFLLRSSDDGKTWSNPQNIYECGKAIYISEVFIFKDEIWAFTLTHDGDFLGFENFVLKSFDNGFTWQKYPAIVQKSGFCFVRGGIVADEKIIFPYQRYDVTSEEQKRLKSNNELLLKANIEFSNNGAFISDDNGKTFHESNNSVDIPMMLNGKLLWKWTEPTIVKTDKDELTMLLRVDGEGFLYKSVSKDLGNTWSVAEKTDIPNPNNKPKLIAIDEKNVALINTFNSDIGFNFRNPLSVWVSNDGLKTFYYKKDVINFNGWLSYPDGFAEKNKIYFAFELNRHDAYFVKCEVKIE